MTIREFELFTLAAAIMAFWEQLRALLAWPVGLLIVRRRTDSFSSGPVLSYLRATARWRPRSGYYSSERPHGRAGRAVRLIDNARRARAGRNGERHANRSSEGQ